MELLWTVRLNNVKSSKTNYWHDLTRKYGIQMFLEEINFPLRMLVPDRSFHNFSE